MNALELAMHFKEMRDMQKNYFDSRNGGRYGNKKLLAIAKAKEKELDVMVHEIIDAGLNEPLTDKYHITIPSDYWQNKFGVDFWNNATPKQRDHIRNSELSESLGQFIESGKVTEGCKIELLPSKSNN